MSDVIFEVVKLVIMLVALVAARYFVPWIKTLIDADKLDVVQTWVMNVVLKIQQVNSAKTGPEKKAIAVDFLKRLLSSKHIFLTDEQLDVLIEAAVKEMKMQENAGVVIETVDNN